MNARIEELLRRIHELESELEADLEEKRTEFRYRIEDGACASNGKCGTSRGACARAACATSWRPPCCIIVTVPVIYGALLPLLLLDLAVTVYQGVCFPVYGILRVPRKEFFVYDGGCCPT